MTKFCNPYHFVPVEKTSSQTHHLKVADFDQTDRDQRNKSLENYSHAQYSGTFSGRIICRLTTESAIFVGAAQERPNPNDVAIAHHFELEGKPAIPASSLRGLLSSLAETASNSALRVLDDRVLSYRQRAKDALSAIGMVVCQKDEQGQLVYRLKPLTLLSKEQEKPYQQLFPKRIEPIRIPWQDSFLKGKKTFNFAAPEFCYFKQNNPFLTSEEWNQLLPSEQEQYTRGILRILGKAGRRDMANAKKYDLFIPYPEEKENLSEEELQQLPRILPEAIERFEQLADERTEATAEKEEQKLNILPYHPIGTPRNSDNDPRGKLRLKTGDLVYFRPTLDQDGKTVIINEISFSAIWRARVETNNKESASVHHFFSKIAPELLPFNKDRELISPAELLFGFVQKDKNKEDAGGRALAGRVHVSFGLLDPKQQEPYYKQQVILKSLLSPKPPCPIMYFKGRDVQEPIKKSNLTPDKHIPQGRKMYLHSYPEDDRKQPWKTVAPKVNKKLKTKVQPLKPKTVFYFHLDFYNLNRWELGLLCYALRPTDSFRHKLGMGKPIGLGTVRIDPLGLFLIDREKRYRTSDLFNSPRYHQLWVDKVLTDDKVLEVLKTLYPQEFKAMSQQIKPAPLWTMLRDEFASTMSPAIKHALKLLGDPSKVRAVVHTPKGDGNIENENFQWFRDNDGKQQLEPLDENSTQIPTLTREVPS